MDELKEMKQKIEFGKININIPREDFHEFESAKEAEIWGQEKYKAWSETYKNIFHMTTQYKEGTPLHVVDPADMYFGFKYHEINEILRTDKTNNYTPDLPFYISNLIMAVFSAPIIGEKIVLYRHVSKKMVQEMVSRNKDKNCLPYEEKGFMSTSMVKACCAKNCGNHDYILKMYVEDRAPIHAIYANLIRQRTEKELLLPPGLYIRMAGYPYHDEETGKTIIEVQLFSMYM
ncbi:MAG: ADP-ribosyltransferase [Oliverpabstia sp.]